MKKMNRWQIVTALVATLLTAAAPAIAQNEGEGQGQAVVTVLPKNDKQPTAPDVSSQTLNVSVNGKHASLTNWQAMRGDQAPVEFVLLIDGAAHTSLGREWDEIEHFVRNLPPNVKVSIAYMENGRAVLTGPLTADHAKALEGLHLTAGVPGYAASPYFCLSSLAKSWPSTDTSARREVLMITDGVDTYERVYDPDDPYVHSAIDDSVKARLVVYSIYWLSNGRADRSWYENNAGQNLLLQVDESTGGTSYWEGTGNPVTLTPYFDDLNRRWSNQYELNFTAPLKGKATVATLKVKTSTPDVKVDAPQEVLVAPAGSARN
jgi:hypothetical protein